MVNIPINEENYHANNFSKNELVYADKIYAKLVKKYSGISGFIDSFFKSSVLNSDACKQRFRSIILAFCITLKRNYEIKQEEQLLKKLKVWLYTFIPYIIKNEEVFITPYPVQFEPKNIILIFLANQLKQNLARIIEPSETAEGAAVFELINLGRAVVSSLLLFTVGDDGHAVALLRGIVEMVCKLAVAEDYVEEYYLFKTFNVFLQANKLTGEPLPKEMLDYVKNEPDYKKNPESFLAYGWIKNKNGKRITTMKEMVNFAIPDGKDTLAEFIHYSSEFIHEDYVFVGYDYQYIRGGVLEMYYRMLVSLLSDKTIEKMSLKKLGILSVKNIINAIDY